MQPLIFCHGFGFDKGFFDRFKALFKDYEILDWDLGYFGKDQKLLKDKAIGIGHSLGFLKLLEKKENFEAIISLGGFVDFLSGSSKRKKELQNLQDLFLQDTKKGLKTFYKSLKSSYTPKSPINSEKLLSDLALLHNSYPFPKDIPILALHAEEDSLVTKGVFEKNFKEAKEKIIIKGDHLFEGQEAFIAESILRFLDGIS